MLRRLLPLLLLAACKGDTVASFELYQDCFDDLVDNGGREVVAALVECCLDHPIDGESPACGDNAPDCTNYLTDNVSQFDAGIVEITDACAQVEEMLDEPSP